MPHCDVQPIAVRFEVSIFPHAPNMSSLPKAALVRAGFGVRDVPRIESLIFDQGSCYSHSPWSVRWSEVREEKET